MVEVVRMFTLYAEMLVKLKDDRAMKAGLRAPLRPAPLYLYWRGLVYLHWRGWCMHWRGLVYLHWRGLVYWLLLTMLGLDERFNLEGAASPVEPP